MRHLIRILPLLFAAISCGGGESRTFPLPVDESRSMLSLREGKEVLESRLLDDMERDTLWHVREGKPELSYTRENVKDGIRAMRTRVSLVDSAWLARPGNRTPWNTFAGDQGGTTCVALEFDSPQDWSGWNRISLWVYIHPSKNPNVSFAMDIVDGTADATYTPGRETNIDIPQGKWVNVLWEISGINRSSVKRFEICQTCTGYDRAIGEQYVTIDFDRLELQKVKEDHFEGWNIEEGTIAFSHAGYRPGDGKIALAWPSDAERFYIENEKGRTFFKGWANRIACGENEFTELDFGAFDVPGEYRIRFDGAVSGLFRIGRNVWQEPLWNAVNFYFCQRCGYPVPGIHDVCHEDVTGFYKEEKKVINGGWHDAGDLSQGFWRTAYGCYALLDAMDVARGSLRDRIADEVKWGLLWLMKVRFSGGRHISWSLVRYYSDGELGTLDDISTMAEAVPWEMMQGAAVFLKAAGKLKLTADEKEDLEKAALDDWQDAVKAGIWETSDYREAAWGTIASAALYECYGEERFRDAAMHFGNILLACQEKENVEGIPYKGFFYRDTAHLARPRDNHAAFCEAPMLAVAAMCRTFPEESGPYRDAAKLFIDGYLIPGSEKSAPYNLLPADVFSIFPRWDNHIFHGATNVHLSQAWALALAARVTGDAVAMKLVQMQLEWTLGRNPFSSSLMYGVGYNFAPNFVYCTRNIAGAIPVGIDCKHDDMPYWSESACATSHEIWIEPVSRFVGTLSAYLLAQ